MKKSILVIGTLVVSAISLTAFAFSISFADSSQFESWYADSVGRMTNSGILKGYPDGTFKPANNVNRAELAVILDRFQQNIDGNTKASSGDAVSKAEMTEALKDLEQKFTESSNTEHIVQSTLLAYDKFSDLTIDRNFKIYLVMAEAGFKELTEKPAMTNFTKVTDVQLPEGYTLYRRLAISSAYYLNYVGPKLVGGDAIMQADQWFGPFSAL